MVLNINITIDMKSLQDFLDNYIEPDYYRISERLLEVLPCPKYNGVYPKHDVESIYKLD